MTARNLLGIGRWAKGASDVEDLTVLADRDDAFGAGV
jgi:hypothetical protein